MCSTSQDHQNPRDLRVNSKIISYSNGQFELEVDNLDALVSSVEPRRKDEPVAVVSIIGPSGSGKSFYTNLLINNLRGHGMVWVPGIDNHNDGENTEPLLGFSYGNVNSSVEILPNAETGIYLWPESFSVPNLDGNMTAWILHIHISDKDKEVKVVEMLDALIMLLSSQIVEINYKIDKVITALHFHNSICINCIPRKTF